MDILQLQRELSQTICDWEPGALLMTQGSECDSLYIVLDGQLDIWTEMTDRSRWVGTIRSGEMVGEVCLLDPGPATATVRAATACRTIRLDPEALESMWRDSPRLASELHTQVVRTLAGRLREATCELDQLEAAARDREGSWKSPTA